MIQKIKNYIGLRIVIFGIYIMESVPFGMLTFEDKKSLSKLWEYYDQFMGEK